MNIKILSNCIKCGACTEIAAEVFDIYEPSVVVNEYKIEANEDICIDAVLTCPVGAIKVEI